MKYLFSIILISIIFVTPISAKQELKSGDDLVHKMYDKYHTKWYKNLTFKQRTIFYKNNEQVREELWHEAMQIPEGLIIKFGKIKEGNGLLFKNDTMTVFQNGEKTSQSRRVHDLLVLGFSIYSDKPEVTISKLKEVGFDLTKIKTEKIDGNTYYVVGDPAKKRFWIEAKNLLFTKVETHNSNGSISITEFKDYEKLKKGWIAPIVNFYLNGEITMKEIYYDIKVPKGLPKNLLEEASFKKMTW